MATLHIDDAKNMNVTTLKKAIQICKGRLGTDEIRNSTVQTEKWQESQRVYEKALEKLQKQIDVLKSTPDPADPGKTYFETIVEGKETTVTMAYISQKLADKGGDPATLENTGVEDAEMDPSQVNVRRNLFDVAKDWGRDILNGRGGRHKAAVTAAVGIAGADIASKLVTTKLAEQGIVGSAMGLPGLLQFGISKLPGLASGAANLLELAYGFAPIGLIAGGVFLALKGIPMLKRGIEKLAGNIHDKVHVQDNFENKIREMMEAQPELA